MIGIKRSTLTIIAALIVLLLTSLLISGCMDAADQPNGDAQNQLDSNTSEQTDEPETLFPEGMLEGLQKNGFLIESLDEISCEIDPSRETRYYGTYHDYVVFFSAGQMRVNTEITVAGETFFHGNYFNIFVYKDGDLYKIQEAYEKGILNEEDIKGIAEYHKRYNGENE